MVAPTASASARAPPYQRWNACVCNATHGMPNMRAQLPCAILLTAYVAYVRVCCAPVTCLPGHVRRRAEFAHWMSGLEQWLGSLSEEPIPAHFQQMNTLDNLNTPTLEASVNLNTPSLRPVLMSDPPLRPSITARAAPSPARIAVRGNERGLASKTLAFAWRFVSRK